jgi:hypothetical protein
MADIRGRFGYMKRALPNFIEVGRRLSEALDTGRVEEAMHIAADFAPYRSLFGEDLTAVRDELVALSAGAAAEAYRLNRGLIILEMVMLGLASLIGLGLSLIGLGLSLIGLGLSLIGLGLSLIGLGLSLIGLGLSLIVSNRIMAGLERLIEGTRGFRMVTATRSSRL